MKKAKVKRTDMEQDKRTECEPSQLVAAEGLQYLMHPILNASQQRMLNGHPAKADHA